MANYDGLTRNAWPGTWSTNGTHPITLDTEQRGGLRYISGSGTDTLVNIPSGMLQDGMLAYVASGYHADVSTDKYYKYSVLEGESRNSDTGFLPNASGNWSEFTTGGDVTTSQLNYVSGIAVYASGIGPPRTYNNITADFTMTDSSDVVFFDTSSNAININLPTAVGKGGQELLFKFKDGPNSGVLIGNGSETIDGNSVYPMYHKNQSISLISDNSNWYVT